MVPFSIIFVGEFCVTIYNLLTQLIHDLLILLPQTLIFSLSLNGSFANNSYYFLTPVQSSCFPL